LKFNFKIELLYIYSIKRIIMNNNNQNVNLSTSDAALEMDRLWRNRKIEPDAMKKFWDLYGKMDDWARNIVMKFVYKDICEKRGMKFGAIQKNMPKNSSTTDKRINDKYKELFE